MQQTTAFGRLVGEPRTGSPRAPPGFCLWRHSGQELREDGMNRIDLKHEIEKDIERYSSILEMYKTGKLKTGNIEGQDRLIDRTGEVTRHLENIIRELQALLRDG
jgi:hypothetical protein